MSQDRVFARTVLVVMWLICAGTVYSAAVTMTNILNLGWPTLLFYAAAACSLLYPAVGISKLLWRIK